MADYSAYLSCQVDGSVWWRRADAIRLGAGFVPSPDGRLMAQSNAVRAGERQIMAAFKWQEALVPPPVEVPCDGELYVEAESFLMWLGAAHAAGKGPVDFPVQLARDVQRVADAQRKAAPFRSLEALVADHLDSPFDDLPADLQDEVKAKFFPAGWEWLSRDQRQKRAQDWDYWHDPATEGAREYFFNRYVEIAELKAERAGIDSADTSKERRAREIAEHLKDLEDTLARVGPRLRKKIADARRDRPSGTFVSYPQALSLLGKRCDATAHDVAGWLFYGPESGGLRGFVDPHASDRPARFFFQSFNEQTHYLSLLSACWFVREDLDAFNPKITFMTGRQLLERWDRGDSFDAKAFIQAKVAEGSLSDLHPTFGLTQATIPNNRELPPLEEALFERSEVEAVEETQLEDVPEESAVTGPSCSAQEIKKAFVLFPKDRAKSDKWWKERMADAKRCGLVKARSGKGVTGPGGSRWRPVEVARWLIEAADAGSQPLNSRQIAACLKRIPGCEAHAAAILEALEGELP